MRAARALDALLEASVAGPLHPDRLSGQKPPLRLDAAPRTAPGREDRDRHRGDIGARPGGSRTALRPGSNVCIVGRDAEKTERAAAELPGATPAVVDLSSIAATCAFAEQFASTHANLDVLVLNAGA